MTLMSLLLSPKAGGESVVCIPFEVQINVMVRVMITVHVTMIYAHVSECPLCSACILRIVADLRESQELGPKS